MYLLRTRKVKAAGKSYMQIISFPDSAVEKCSYNHRSDYIIIMPLLCVFEGRLALFCY